MAERTDEDQVRDQHTATEGGGRRPPRRVKQPSPGATASPQLPGAVPDQEAIPGYTNLRVERVEQAVRPLSELGTTQGIMGVFAATAENAMDPARFEQATASYEELRKAYPSDLPAIRPAPGRELAADQAVPVVAATASDPLITSTAGANAPATGAGTTPAPGDAGGPGGVLPSAQSAPPATGSGTSGS